ncbi:MAG: superoxide dismutase, Ni [Proteobacteria bacterium]|nr:MAG: superoxide dismutase, Ni [Pseudomonadota bacterium]
MIHSLLSKLDRQVKFSQASAHCDVPCGIYDPSTAQIAALTVIRMMDLLAELGAKESLSLKEHAQLSRLVAQKEEHALKAKEEVRIIWGDYFKQPQFEQVAGVHELVHNIMMQGSKCRQNTDRAMGEEFLKLINEFAEAFWKTKGVETYTATCPYPPSESVVYPKLGG